MQTENFWAWAEKEIDKRGLSWHRIERTNGMSNATISRRARELTPPSTEVCHAIARAFNIPPEEVFRRAGLLPPAPERTPGLIEAEHLFLQLKPEQRALLLATMRAWVAAEPIADDAEA